MGHLNLLQSLTNEELISKIVERETEIAELKALFRESTMQNGFLLNKLERFQAETSLSFEYCQRWSWINKIIYTLQELNKPSTSSEILNLLLEFDTDLRFTYEQIKYLSPHYTKAVKYGRILQHKIKGIKGYYYILPEWIDKETALLKEEYRKKIVELR